MTPIDEIALTRLDDLFGTARQITTVSHIHPDGDAIGSSLALYHWLKARGKDVVSVFPDPIPDTLTFMAEGLPPESVLSFSASPGQTRRRIAGSDLLVCLDFNTFSRVEQMESLLSEATARKVLIDHHRHPERALFDLAFSDTEVSSTAELLYYLLRALPGELPLASATALMTGMTTDTNNFANSTYPSTLRMASQLLEQGVDREAILAQVLRHFRINRLQLLGDLLHDRLRLRDDGLAYMILDHDLQHRHDIREGETEGFVNLPLTAATVRLSLFIKEEADCWRVSIRSKQGVPAGDLARDHFAGGGHLLAAGGRLYPEDGFRTSADVAAYVERITRSFLDGLDCGNAIPDA